MNQESKKLLVILILILAVMFFLSYTNSKIRKIEKQYYDIEAKISSLQALNKIYEERIDKKITDIKNLQLSNDKKLKEVSNVTFRQNYKMSNDDVIAGWDNFMSDVRKRNSDRNID